MSPSTSSHKASLGLFLPQFTPLSKKKKSKTRLRPVKHGRCSLTEYLGLAPGIERLGLGKRHKEKKSGYRGSLWAYPECRAPLACGPRVRVRTGTDLPGRRLLCSLGFQRLPEAPDTAPLSAAQMSQMPSKDSAFSSLEALSLPHLQSPPHNF